MELCSDNHEEICFEGRTCPYCDMLEKKDEEIQELKDKVEKLKDEIYDLENPEGE